MQDSSHYKDPVWQPLTAVFDNEDILSRETVGIQNREFLLEAHIKQSVNDLLFMSRQGVHLGEDSRSTHLAMTPAGEVQMS